MTEPQPVLVTVPEVRPNPDPTARTTEQIQREVHMLKEVITQRMDGYDKAIALIQMTVDREPKPPVLASDILHLRELVTTMFTNIETRFSDRDKRNEHMIQGSKALVDNTISSMRDAFVEQNKAQQQAIGKSEASITKQMEQMNSQFNTEIKSLSTTITDVKDRITAIENRGMGKAETKDDLRAIWAVAAGAVAMIVSIITVIYTVNRPPPTVQYIPPAPAPISAPAPAQIQQP